MNEWRKESTNKPTYKPTNKPTNKPFDPPTTQPTYLPTNQPTNQPTNPRHYFTMTIIFIHVLCFRPISFSSPVSNVTSKSTGMGAN